MGLEVIIIAAAAFVISAASAAYQVVQAKKMKAQAQAAADARKGFELVVEGEPEYLPIVYGRAMIGGTRTYHNTRNDFAFDAPNSDKSFLTGSPAYAGYNYTYSIWDANLYAQLGMLGTVSQQGSGYMSGPLSGGKNDFLAYQQALCVGPINAVRDVIIDGARFIDDPTLGTYGEIQATTGKKKTSGVKAALRLDYHYNGGADSVMAANFPERKDSKFTRAAYLSAFFRIDRDDPQFQGVPGVQSYIEGRKVRWVANGVLSTTKSYEEDPTKYRYTTSPSLCLLDYLLDRENGKGCDVGDLDLFSFEAADALCRKVVQSGVAVGGKFWKPTDGIGATDTRDLPLYECNIVVDTSKPVRENVEAILSTMGDARLVWSGGKYRLSMQYPETNDKIVLAGVITDDDLVMGEDVSIAWPTASDRYNHCKIRFHNEYEGFKEDSVSWPPKYNNSYARGIGAQSYPQGVGGWDELKEGGRLLSAYGVWNGAGDSTSMTWKLRVNPDQAGTYALAATGDNTISVSIKDDQSGASVLSLSNNNWKVPAKRSVTLGSSAGVRVYTITVSGTNDGNAAKAVAVKIDNANVVLWTTRSTSYDSYAQVTESDAVYREMLAEDNGLELEADIFSDGITDTQHALAKAEELVRSSRTAAGYKFKYVVTDRFYEPGDFVQLKSLTLNVGYAQPLYLRVEGVKVVGDDRCEVEASRFDYTQLAWNVKDDVNISAPPVYNIVLPQPYEIRYLAPNKDNTDSSGRLECDPVAFPEFSAYVWFMHRAGVDGTDGDGKPILTEIARTTTPSYDLPSVNAASAFFGVKALSSNGRMSRITTTDPRAAITLTHNWLRAVTIDAPVTTFLKQDGGGFAPVTLSLVARAQGFVSPTFEWYLGSTRVGTGGTLVVAGFNESSRVYSLLAKEASDPTGVTADADVTILSYSAAEAGSTRGSPNDTYVAGQKAQDLVKSAKDSKDAIGDANSGLTKALNDTATAISSADSAINRSITAAKKVADDAALAISSSTSTLNVSIANAKKAGDDASAKVDTTASALQVNINAAKKAGDDAAAGVTAEVNNRLADTQSIRTTLIGSIQSGKTVSSLLTDEAVTRAADDSAMSARITVNETNYGWTGFTPNPKFGQYATTSGRPAYWNNEGDPGAARLTRVLGEGGVGYALRASTTAGVGTYMSAASPMGVVRQSQWIVLEMDVKLISGTLQGLGIFARTRTSGGANSNEYSLKCGSDPDTSGGAPGDGAAGKTYRFRKLMQITNADADQLVTFLGLKMGQTSSPSNNTGVDSVYELYLVNVRPATDPEIKAQKADDTLNTPQSGVVARLQTVQTTLGDSTSGLVKSFNDLNVQINPTGGPSVTARLSTAELAIGDSTKGLVKKTNDLSTSVTKSGQQIMPENMLNPGNWTSQELVLQPTVFDLTESRFYLNGEGVMTFTTNAGESIKLAPTWFFKPQKDRTYRVTWKVRRWNAATSGTSLVDFGFVWKGTNGGDNYATKSVDASTLKGSATDYDELSYEMKGIDGMGWARPRVHLNNGGGAGARFMVAGCSVQDVTEILDTRASVKDISTAISTPGTGYAAKISALETSVGNNTTGKSLTARLEATESALNDGTTGVVARTSKLEVRPIPAGNMLPNTSWPNKKTTGWNVPTGLNIGVNNPTDEWHPKDENVFSLYSQGDAGVTGYAAAQISERLPVDDTRWYQFYSFNAAHRCRAEMRMIWFDASGAQITSQTNWTGGATVATGGVDPKNYTQMGFKSVKPPAGAVQVEVGLGKWGTVSGETNSWMFIWRPYFGETYEGNTAWNPYVPGNGTTVLDDTSSRLATAETVIGTASSGLVKKTEDLNVQINKAGDGINAKLTDTRLVVGDANSGLVQKVTSLDSQLNTQGTGVAAKLTDLTTTVTDPTNGLTSRMSRAETRYGQLPVRFLVRSAGYAGTDAPWGNTSTGLYAADGTALFAVGRSYGAVVFGSGSNAISFSKVYDVYGSTAAATELANMLNGVTKGQTIVIMTNDEPVNNHLQADLLAAMEGIGAGQGYRNIKNRGAYVLIGRAGLGKGRGLELVGGLVDSDPKAFVETYFDLYKGIPDLSGNGDAVGTNARLTTTESTLSDPSTGVVKRLADLYTDVNTGSTSVKGRLSTAETAISTNDTAITKRASVLESAALLDGAALNANPRFGVWPTDQELPLGYNWWNKPSGASATRITQDAFGTGSKNVRIVAPASECGLGMVNVPFIVKGWYVIDVAAAIRSGDWRGAGVTAGGQASIDFASTPDNDGVTTSSASVVDRRWTQLVYIGTGGNVNFHCMANWTPFNKGLVAKTVDFVSASIRPASRAEVLGQQASESLLGDNGVIARLGSTETAIGNKDSGLVKKTEDLSVLLNAANTGVVARLGSVVTAVGDANSGLTQRVNTADTIFKKSAQSILPTSIGNPSQWTNDEGNINATGFVMNDGHFIMMDENFPAFVSAAGESILISAMWFFKPQKDRTYRIVWKVRRLGNVSSGNSQVHAGFFWRASNNTGNYSQRQLQSSEIVDNAWDYTTIVHDMRAIANMAWARPRIHLNVNAGGGVRYAVAGCEVYDVTEEYASNGRITNVETTLGDDTKGLVKRTNDMLATFNTPTTGVLARIGTAETAIAANDSAITQRASVLESSVGRKEYLNRNAAFTEPGYTGAQNSLPAYWDVWSMDGGGYRGGWISQSPSNYGAVRPVQVDRQGTNCGLRNTLYGQFPKGWYVLECEVRLEDGNSLGAGVYTEFNNGHTGRLNFNTDPDTDGYTGPHGTGNYSFTKLVYNGNNTGQIQLYMMAGWDGFAGYQGFLRTIWQKCGIRPATTAEVESGKVSGISAKVSTLEGTVADQTGKLTAYFSKTASVPGADATVEIVATNASGQPTSNVALTATTISLKNKADGRVIPALTAEGGNVIIANDLVGGNGRIIWKSSTHMKVSGTGFGSANQFIEWYGPVKNSVSECTEAQAVYYLRTDGQAFFNGSIAEGQLRNQKTTYDYGNSSVAVGPFVTNGKTRYFVASLAFSLTGTRWSNHADGGATRGNFLLERLNSDNTWTTLGTGSLGNYRYESANNGVANEGEPSLVRKSASGTIEFTDTTGGTNPIQLRARVYDFSDGGVTGKAYQADVVVEQLQITTYEP